MADDKDRKKKKGSARTTALAGLLAVVAVIAAWLSNCIPGFGVGSSGDAEGEAEAEPAVEAEAKEEPKPAEPEVKEDDKDDDKAGEAAGTTLTVTIDVHGCSVGEAAAFECASLCEKAELFEGVDDAILDANGDASHESVIAVTDCLKSKGIDKVAIRRE